MFEDDFLLITASRNIYQLGGLAGDAERRIVRLLAANHADRRPVSVAFDHLHQLIYWTDLSTANILSRPLTSFAQPTVVFAAGRLIGRNFDHFVGKLRRFEGGDSHPKQPVYNIGCEVLQSACLYVCLSVCLSVRLRISKSPSPNLTKFSLHFTQWRGFVFSDDSAICCVLPVLWMTSCLRIMTRHTRRPEQGGICLQ